MRTFVGVGHFRCSNRDIYNENTYLGASSHVMRTLIVVGNYCSNRDIYSENARVSYQNGAMTALKNEGGYYLNPIPLK